MSFDVMLVTLPPQPAGREIFNTRQKTTSNGVFRLRKLHEMPTEEAIGLYKTLQFALLCGQAGIMLERSPQRAGQEQYVNLRMLERAERMQIFRKELETLQRAILEVYDDRRKRIHQDGGLPTARSKPGKTDMEVANLKEDLTELEQLILEMLRKHFSSPFGNRKLTHPMVSVESRGLSFYGLTGRESEIAEWVAAGKTNPEIAVILRISARTVEKHVERVLGKLGVENRTAAALMIHDGHHKERNDGSSAASQARVVH